MSDAGVLLADQLRRGVAGDPKKDIVGVLNRATEVGLADDDLGWVEENLSAGGLDGWSA